MRNQEPEFKGVNIKGNLLGGGREGRSCLSGSVTEMESGSYKETSKSGNSSLVIDDYSR